ncbi:hypothetical protein FAZ19_07465 [Sphingobacterium alkalisoli]|uniref:Uncharacterized protein n=1 Tax=Sphingobacterium alkalisoli TaxID=1874115 RepID=A0A4V5LYZ9_9SPHI|nr:hypothetical protein [Sphingobacterium alkalisoli]TJY66749.1 hypothetical protein FAZ19_07465 [Sphingobacterium alkalisoli]GGH14450.1 hypothetical protein GCM10011418_15400 [Sphingobacterium alkalisoli]
MKIKSTIFALFVLVITSCSKDTVEPIVEPEPEPVEDTEPTEVIAYFHENTAYFQPFVYRFDEATQSWGKRIASHFSAVSEDSPAYLGFVNLAVEDSGVNLFQMVTLYTEHIGTNNIKTAGINVEKLLSFIPNKSSSKLADAPTMHTKGAVEVFAQQVKIRKAGLVEFFEIGISGEGTYDLETGIIDLNVHFDETAIGGSAKVTRKYKISKTAITF